MMGGHRMAGLDRRVAALEQIAEEARLRPYRILAAERGIPFEDLMRSLERVRAKNDRLRAAGLTERQILKARAADLGIDPDELQRRADDLLARFS